MQAPKYINTNIIYQKIQKQAQLAHEQKLEYIRSHKSNISAYTAPENYSRAHLRNRWKSLSNSNF